MRINPTQEDLDDLNSIRAKNGLPPKTIDEVSTVREWFLACNENDEVADQRAAEAEEAKKPYLEKQVTKTVRMYNPKYGDDKVCNCGHTYDRHFDGYEDPEHQDVGCKYCDCDTFVQATLMGLPIRQTEFESSIKDAEIKFLPPVIIFDDPQSEADAKPPNKEWFTESIASREIGPSVEPVVVVTRIAMDAVDRGKNLLWLIQSSASAAVPPLAIEFSNKLCAEAGCCLEVILTAYAAYAQCVEGLPCKDALYKARPQDVEWFQSKLREVK